MLTAPKMITSVTNDISKIKIRLNDNKMSSSGHALKHTKFNQSHELIRVWFKENLNPRLFKAKSKLMLV